MVLQEYLYIIMKRYFVHINLYKRPGLSERPLYLISYKKILGFFKIEFLTKIIYEAL